MEVRLFLTFQGGETGNLDMQNTIHCMDRPVGCFDVDSQMDQ